MKIQKTSTTKKPTPLNWKTTNQVFTNKTSAAFTAGYTIEKTRIEIARSIRQARLAKKITQSQLAKKTAMPQSAIARLESGNHSVSFETLSKVATALGKEIKLV